MKRRRSGLLNCALCGGAVALALLPWLAWCVVPERGTFTFVLENDLFYDLDRHYTNGVQLVWKAPADQVPGLALRSARALPFSDDGKVRTSYVFGQSVHTPSDITFENPPLDDRLYGGWLYGSIGIISESDQRLDQLQLTLGVVGTDSRAEEAQRFVHEHTGADEPRGWDTRLHNEIGVVLAYQRSERAFASAEILGLTADVTPHAGVSLGNVWTYINAGATFNRRQRAAAAIVAVAGRMRRGCRRYNTFPKIG